MAGECKIRSILIQGLPEVYSRKSIRLIQVAVKEILNMVEEADTRRGRDSKFGRIVMIAA